MTATRSEEWRAARVVVVVLLLVALAPDDVVVVQRQERVGRLHEVVVHRPPPRRDGDLRAQALRGLHQRQEVLVAAGDEHEPGLRGLLGVRPRRRLPAMIAHELLGDKLERAARDVDVDAGLAAAAHGLFRCKWGTYRRRRNRGSGTRPRPSLCDGRCYEARLAQPLVELPPIKADATPSPRAHQQARSIDEAERGLEAPLERFRLYPF